MLNQTSSRASGEKFLRARDFLLKMREDYETAYREFRWPSLDRFNWALDYFDEMASGNTNTALWIVDEEGRDHRVSFDEMSQRSAQVANFLRRQGVHRGDRVLVMLPNMVALWEVMLACMKMGAVVVPTTTLATDADLRDRMERGKVNHIVADARVLSKITNPQSNGVRIAVGETVKGWLSYENADGESTSFAADGDTKATDPFLLYFTSGTTAFPKLVLHTHQSYPVGHLVTMYWLGLKKGALHLNISSPGWAKHAWSSFFAPWNAEATIFSHYYSRFDAASTLKQIERCSVTTLCAPPTVWRMIVLEDLASYQVKLREIVSAGEPLNPEIIERVRSAWGVTIRDGYGQTESVLILGNTPGQKVKPGAVGRPTPGHHLILLDTEGNETNEGEICLKLDPLPVSLTPGYMDDPERVGHSTEGGYFHTGDVARRDDDDYYTFVGRADDIFKSSDYRLSPFELESALIEHDAIVEAAVVPSPDPIRMSVPKAFILLKPDVSPSRQVALDIFRFIRGRLSPYKRIRRIQFSELPKTISGKIRRVELRAAEQYVQTGSDRRHMEFWEEDFPELHRE